MQVLVTITAFSYFYGRGLVGKDSALLRASQMDICTAELQLAPQFLPPLLNGLGLCSGLAVPCPQL